MRSFRQVQLACAEFRDSPGGALGGEGTATIEPQAQGCDKCLKAAFFLGQSYQVLICLVVECKLRFEQANEAASFCGGYRERTLAAVLESSAPFILERANHPKGWDAKPTGLRRQRHGGWVTEGLDTGETLSIPRLTATPGTARSRRRLKRSSTRSSRFAPHNPPYLESAAPLCNLLEIRGTFFNKPHICPVTRAVMTASLALPRGVSVRPEVVQATLPVPAVQGRQGCLFYEIMGMTLSGSASTGSR